MVEPYLHLNGRRMILTDETEVNIGNVVQILRKALPYHWKNRSEISYLWSYYKGRQPILNRVKEVRPEITNKIVENRANEIVSFKSGYLICGMPNRNGGSSTSDTGSAVIMRDGWSAAEARAKDSELMFKKSERIFLKVVLNICRTLADMDLKVCNVEIRFTRRNYENILQKAQVLDLMLKNNKIHPRLAFEHCGLFVDSDLAYTLSAEYAEEQEQKAQELFEQQQRMKQDEEFWTFDGDHAAYPGGFTKAENNVNCRCTVELHIDAEEE